MTQTIHTDPLMCQPVKIKLYVLASDTRNGTDSTIYPTQAAMHEAMKTIMEQALERDPELRAMVEAGKIEEAFVDWCENHAEHLDTYNWGEQEIEVPLSISPYRDIAYSLSSWTDRYFAGRTKPPIILSLQDKLRKLA